MDQKQNCDAYERHGIKFRYIPLVIYNTEGQISSTTLQANIGVSSYALEIKSDKIADILPIAKNDVDIFNRIILAFLANDKTYNSTVEIKEESEIIITIDVNVFGKIQKMKLVLVHENVGETILMKRKIDYLTEKIEQYESTKIHYINMQTCVAIYNIKTGEHRLLGDQKEICDGNRPINNLTRYGKELMESKTEGFYKEICNYDLLKYLEQTKEYKDYLEYVNKSNSVHVAHPLLMWYGWWLYDHPTRLLEFYLFLINNIGYEMVDISLRLENHYYSSIMGLKVKRTKNKYKYIIEGCPECNTIPQNHKFYTVVGRDTLYSIEKILI